MQNWKKESRIYMKVGIMVTINKQFQINKQINKGEIQKMKLSYLKELEKPTSVVRMIGLIIFFSKFLNYLHVCIDPTYKRSVKFDFAFYEKCVFLFDYSIYKNRN